ncbi:MAG: hypothetical protein KC766_28805, partial [Myxococcales bacterium]|nr:hypothetical protein [Myxococcales bacterium]
MQSLGTSPNGASGATRAAHRGASPGGELPSPIPWLGAAGEVPALDGVTTEQALQTGLAPRNEPAGLAEPAAKQACGCGASGGCGSKAGSTAQTVAAAAGAADTAAPAAPNPQKAKASRPKKKRPGSGIPARKGIRILVWVRR